MGGQALDDTLCTPCARLLSLDTVYLSALTFVLNAALGAVSVPPSLCLCLSVSHFIFFLVPVSFSSVLIFIMLYDSLPSLPCLNFLLLFVVPPASLSKQTNQAQHFIFLGVHSHMTGLLSLCGFKREHWFSFKKKSVQGGKSQPVGKSNQRNMKPILTHRTTFSSQTNADPASKDGKNFMGWISRIVKGEMSRWKNENN